MTKIDAALSAIGELMQSTLPADLIAIDLERMWRVVFSEAMDQLDAPLASLAGRNYVRARAARRAIEKVRGRRGALSPPLTA